MARSALRILRRFVTTVFGVALCGFVVAAALGDPRGDVLGRDPGAAASAMMPSGPFADLPYFFNTEPEDAAAFARSRMRALETAAEKAGRAIAEALRPAATGELSASSQIHLWCVAAADGRETAVEALAGVSADVRATLGRARAELAASAPLLRRLIRRGGLTARHLDPVTDPAAAPYAATVRTFVRARAAERETITGFLDVHAALLAAAASPPGSLVEEFARLSRISDVPSAGVPASGDAAADAARSARIAARFVRHEGLRYREFRGPLDHAVAAFTETRFGVWLGDIVRGDLGDSLGVRPGTAVLSLLAERIPRTIALILPSFVLLFVVGAALGVRAAGRPGGPFDRTIGAGTGVLHALPEFWTGTMLVVFLAGPAGGLLPVSGLRSPEIGAAIAAGASPWSFAALRDLLAHLIAPTIVLTLPGIVVVFRHVRAAAMDARGSAWFATLKLRGADDAELRRRLRRHVLPALAALTGASLPALIGGSVVVETLFDVPGAARLAAEAAVQRDTTVAAAVVLVAGLVSVLGRRLADLVAVRVDPRQSESPS